MFLFQGSLTIKEKEWDAQIKKMKISNEAKELLNRFIKGEGDWKRRTTLNFYFRSEIAASNFVVAMASLSQYFKNTYGVEITTTGIGAIKKTKDGYEVVIYKRKAEGAEGKIAGVPTPTHQAVPTGVAPGVEVKPPAISGEGKVVPAATMADIEKRAQELREKGYLGVEIVDSEKEAREKLGGYPKGSETVFEKYTIETGVDDSLSTQKVEVFASSMSIKYGYTIYFQTIPNIIHGYGYYFTPNTGYYSLVQDRDGHGSEQGALNIRTYAGNPGGTAAYIYNAHADFLSRNKKTAKKRYKNDPLGLAAYLLRGYTGVVHREVDEKTGEVKYNEQKTIDMHKANIKTLVYAYKTFGGIRGTIPDDLWVSLRAFSYAQAENAAGLGIIDKNRKDEYADAFAFGMLAQIWYESGLTLSEFFKWLREEIDMKIDPNVAITTIMKERDEYRIFYGDQEITEETTVKASPYKDLLITMPDGKTPLAHLRISHPKWLDNKKAWDGNKKYANRIQPGVFITDVAKWSWYGFGGTAYYHPISNEIYFSLTKGGIEDKYLIGYKPVEEKPVEVVNAFSIVGDREARLVGTTFETNGTIIAYGDESINDLKNDENFSLNYIGFSIPKAEREMWFPGLRGKKERYVAYLLIPKGDPIKDRLPPYINNCEKDIQNGALVYEDYRYDLILTINGKRINAPPGIPKYLIDKGLKPENLYYEINPNNTMDIAVFFDENGNPIKDPSKHTGPKYVEVIAAGIQLSPEDVAAIRNKPISEFASFEDNGRTGLDFYLVVKINPDGTKTLVDAARIAGHEFDYKFLYENGYAKEYFGSLDSSRVVVSATGERSYHIMPTDIPPGYRDLLVGTIPRELITTSRDGKRGEFTATFHQNTEMAEGLRGVSVNYYMNYTGKLPVSFEFANLPVSIETLASKDSKTRKAAISQLLSLSQNPMSPGEASNYMGLISEVEAKWKNVLDKEDRKNLAEARANFERYSGMVRAGEMAAGGSERYPTKIEAPTPPYVGEEEMRPAPDKVIPRDWIKTVPPKELDKWMPRFEGAYMNMWAAFAKSIENPDDPSIKNYTQSFMKNMGLPSSADYASLSQEEKMKIQYLLFGVSNVEDGAVIAFLKAFETGNVDYIRKMAQENPQSPMRVLLENLSKFKVMIPQALVMTGVGGTIFRFESEGYIGGKYGAPQRGLAFDLSAFVDFIYEGWRAKYITLNFETGEANFANDYVERYGLEPKLKAKIEQRFAGGEELYAEGTYGIRLIFDDLGRLATGKPKTSYGVGKFAVGVENVRIGNVMVGIEGNWERFPVFEGTADRYSVEGKADFLLLSIPWEVKAGGRTTINGEMAEKTAFAIVTAKLVETEGGYSIQPFVGAEYKGINDYLQRGGGILFGSPFGQTKFGIWQRNDGKLVFDVGIGVEF